MTGNNLLLKKEEMLKINNDQPPEAKYGDVFTAIAQAQLDKVIKAGYVKLANGDRVICKTAWDLLSPVIKKGIKANAQVSRFWEVETEGGK